MLLVLAANYDWSISTVDIKAAFLQGRPINKDIYIKLPREVSIEGKIWKFKTGKRKSGDFRYVGLKIKKEKTGISVNQDLYAEEIEEVRFDVKRKSNTYKLDQGETRLLLGFAGQINWISFQTRPDVSFDILELSIEQNKAFIGILKRANKVVRKIKMRESEIFFP